MKLKSSRGIVMKLICCMALVVMSSVFASSQRAASLSIPTSGAMLTISGTVGSNSVNRNIYDSQIHTTTVQTVPLAPSGGSNCNSVDVTFTTDAYVLQGGSGTGCDPGDTFEELQGASPGGLATIAGTGYSFGIETTYTFGGCNTSGTICANPDTGFLTVTNNSGAPFSGTISLTGTSPIQGDPSCPVNGVASDTWTNGLTASGTGRSVTLALGSQGSIVSITAASEISPNDTYTYTLTSGPSLQVGQTIVISGMSDSGNNGPFSITALGTGT